MPETEEFRFWVRLRMTPEEQQAYRAEQAAGPGDSTRLLLAGTLQTEVDGTGLTSGWWHDVRVN